MWCVRSDNNFSWVSVVTKLSAASMADENQKERKKNKKYILESNIYQTFFWTRNSSWVENTKTIVKRRKEKRSFEMKSRQPGKKPWMLKWSLFTNEVIHILEFILYQAARNSFQKTSNEGYSLPAQTFEWNYFWPIRVIITGNLFIKAVRRELQWSLLGSLGISQSKNST